MTKTLLFWLAAVAGLALLSVFATPAFAQANDVLVDASFESSNDGFAYRDDALDTNEPSYASGSRPSFGALSGNRSLSVALGGDDNAFITNMSGGWQITVAVPRSGDIDIQFQYELIQSSEYESDEFSTVRARWDNGDIGGTIAEIRGDSNGGSDRSTGLRTFSTTLNNVSAGDHTLLIGAFNSKKTYFNETTTLLIDEVLVSADPAPTPTPVPPTATPTAVPPTATPTATATPTTIPTATATPTAVPPTPTPVPLIQGSPCGGGALSQEAEAGTLSGTLAVIAADGAVGGAALQAVVGSGGRTYPSADYADYCVTVPAGQAGAYQIDAIVLAENSADDSFYITIDNEPGALWPLAKAATWTNDAVRIRSNAAPTIFNLAEGDHRFRISQREDGAAIDNFSFTFIGTPTCAGLRQEAESGVARGSMIRISDSTASGAQAVQARPGSIRQDYPSANVVEFCVNVPATGDYRIDARVQAANADSDSFYVRVDDQSGTLWPLEFGADWAQDSVRPRKRAAAQIYGLGSGDHTLRIYQREAGATIDWFELVQVNLPTPTPTATATPTPTPTPLPGVTFYRDYNQAGPSVSAAPGEYSSSDFGAVGNNQVSSFSLTDGYQLLTCNNADGTSTCKVFTDSKARLGDFGVNDTISYFQLRAPGDEFVIRPENDLQNIVDASPAGTRFVLTSGLHSGEWAVPKSNMVFRGESGAILDGGGMSRPAFIGSHPQGADNIEIRNLEIRNYNPGTYGGAISGRAPGNFSLNGNNWIVDGNTIHDNNAVGINVGPGMKITNNTIYNNLQMGISGLGDADRRMPNVEIRGNEIYRNSNPNPQFENVYHEGGIKLTYADNLVIDNNNIHDNWGTAAYCDLYCDGVEITNNLLLDNQGRRLGAGVFFEWSLNGTIRNNTIRVSAPNGVDNSWDWSGITIAESQNVLVEGNNIQAENGPALMFRGIPGGERYTPRNITFRNNRVESLGGESRVGFVSGTDNTEPTIRWEGNDYFEGAGHIRFTWSGEKSWSWWQGRGKDTAASGGSYTR